MCTPLTPVSISPAFRLGALTSIVFRNLPDERYTTVIREMLEYLHLRAESNETCLCQEATMVSSVDRWRN